MNSRLVIAAGDINSSPVLARRFRGKTAKEIYRFGKGIIYTAVGQVGETAIGYVIRYLYKVIQPSK